MWGIGDLEKKFAKSLASVTTFTLLRLSTSICLSILFFSDITSIILLISFSNSFSMIWRFCFLIKGSSPWTFIIISQSKLFAYSATRSVPVWWSFSLKKLLIEYLSKIFFISFESVITWTSSNILKSIQAIKTGN